MAEAIFGNYQIRLRFDSVDDPGRQAGKSGINFKAETDISSKCTGLHRSKYEDLQYFCFFRSTSFSRNDNRP